MIQTEVALMLILGLDSIAIILFLFHLVRNKNRRSAPENFITIE